MGLAVFILPAVILGVLLHDPVRNPQKEQETIYVDANAQPGGDGDTWETAFNDLQDAIANAKSSRTDSVEIRIAQGRYTPDSGTGEKHRRFEISGLDSWTLLGGFPAGGGTLEERSAEQYTTILSGDLLIDDELEFTPMEFDAELNPLNLAEAGVKYLNRSDNSIGVVYAHSVYNEILIDGVVIEGGHANDELNRSGGGIHASEVNLTLRDVQLIENYAQVRGGGVYVVGPNARLCIENSYLSLNLSLEAGGAIYSSSSMINVVNATLSMNASFLGGGQFSERGVIDIRESTYSHNVAFDQGGGFLGGSFGNVLVSDSTFSNNSSLSDGGGFRVTRPVSVMMCTFEWNIATGRGGGMHIDSDSTVSHSVFRSNTSGASGGGANVYGDNALSNCLFELNTSNQDGGGLWMTNGTVLTDSIVRLNTAVGFGGGINTGNRTRLQGVRIEDNSTQGRGGGIHATSGAVLTDIKFEQNDALIDGGGLYMGTDSLLSHSTFRQNTAGRSGGAIAMNHGNTVSVVLIDTNFAAVSGGGIRSLNTENTVSQITCIHNDAPQSGGIFGEIALDITDSVIWSNYAQAGTIEEAQVGGVAHNVISTLIMGLDQYAANGNIGDDPLFINEFGQDQLDGTGDEDLRLSTDSPAVDVGSGTGISSNLGPFDLDGYPRYVGFGGAEFYTIDMGAYETQDCDADSMSDAESIMFGLVQDCNSDGVPDVCQSNSFTQSEHTGLEVPDAQPMQRFGHKLILSEGILAVSAILDQDQAINAGAVYLFDAESGSLRRKITADDANDSAVFGTAIGLSQGLLAVGSPGDNTAGYQAGAVYIFDTDTGDQLAKVIPGNARSYDNFGYGVAIGGGYLAVGSSRPPSNLPPNAGTVYVLDVSTYEVMYQIVFDEALRDHEIGRVLRIHDGLLYIGYEQDSGDEFSGGSVLVYRLSDGELMQKIVPDETLEFAKFGSSIDLRGAVLAVGAHNHGEQGQGSGALYLFDLGTGTQLHKLIPSDIEIGDRFGLSVALGDTAVVAGAPDGGNGNGVVYMYDMQSGELISKLVDPDGEYYEAYGASIALDDDKFYVSNNAWRADSDASGDVFAVYPSLEDIDQDGVPDSCTCAADFDASGELNFFDVSAFIIAFQSGDPRADFVIDGLFNFFDISVFIELYLKGCAD